MPAPIRPNTEAASAVVRRRGQETAAAKLNAAGWLVITPESADAVREVIQRAKDRGELVEWHVDLKGGEQADARQKQS